MQIRFKKLHASAQSPAHASKGAAGFDLVCTGINWNADKKMVKYHTGLAVEIPEGHVGLLFPRSSISKTGLRVANGTGVIDSDYRGEITLVCDIVSHNLADLYEIGERIGQLLIVPLPYVEWVESDGLSDTERGTGGYGSTGR